jgi:hypothetical protein
MYGCSNLCFECYLVQDQGILSTYFVTSAIYVYQILRQMLKAPVEQINRNALQIGMHTRNVLQAPQATDY